MNEQTAQNAGQVSASFLKRLVSVLRSTPACCIYHFLVFVFLWGLFGKLAEGSGFIKFGSADRKSGPLKPRRTRKPPRFCGSALQPIVRRRHGN